MSDQNNKGDCYSSGERGFMEWGQRVRAQFLLPFLKFLTLCKIHPDHLTFLSLAAGLAAAVCLLVNLPLALFLLFLHVAFDGIDGPLARYQGVASNRGSFIDTVADQCVITAVAGALYYIGHADGAATIFYVTLYTACVAFAMVRNALGIPYSWLVRPRFFIYLWLPVEFWVIGGTLSIVLWCFNFMLAVKVATGFWHIKEKL